MPATKFICPDGETIDIERCLKVQGCRMQQRCCTVPSLRLYGFDREWKGVSPSSAGNGPRAMYLKATTGYAISPDSRVWAGLGTSTHDKYGAHKYSGNVLSEQPLSDDDMSGIADVLEQDEWKPGYYVLTDYKTWGSYKVAKALGITILKSEEVVLDEFLAPVILKSGKNKGKPKTKKVSERIIDPATVDLRSEELQLNRYRIFFEQYGFPVSRLQIQAIPRDGGTYIAKGRGIEKNLYIIPVKKLLNDFVLDFYKTLNDEVLEAFKTGYVRLCNSWENWEYRRCDGYCEVAEACKEMSRANDEKWGVI
jgi:hypothetical protein